MSEDRGGLREAAIALIIRVASAALVFGLQVLLARLMPTESYGGFVSLWTWMLALGSFAALGFAESSVRFLPRYQARGRVSAVVGYWRHGLAIVAGGSVALGLFAAITAVVLGLPNGHSLTLLLVAVGLPFLAMEYYLEGVARSFGWFRLAAVPVYIVRPVLIAATCLVLSGAGVALTLPVVGAVLVGAMALVTAGLTLVMQRRLARLSSDGRRASAGQKRLWLRASLPLLLLSGLEDLTSYADLLMLSLLADAEAVAVYFAAARSLALAGFVAYAMTLVFGRRFALDRAGRSRAELQASITQSTRVTLWATLVAVAGGIAAGPLLLEAFGPQFADGYVVMLVLGLGMVVRAMAGQAGEALIVLGRQRAGMVVGLLVLAVTAGLALLLIPIWGMLGAAVASAAAMSARTVALTLVLKRLEDLDILAFAPPWPRPRA